MLYSVWNSIEIGARKVMVTDAVDKTKSNECAVFEECAQPDKNEDSAMNEQEREILSFPLIRSFFTANHPN